MDMTSTKMLLENIFTTIQDLEVKGEKNCSYIVGISNAIKQHLRELQEMESVQNGIK